MAGPQPVAITVSSAQQTVLEGLLRQHSCPQALALRTRIVLGAAGGSRNQPLAQQLGCSAKTVWKWRKRWAAAEARLAAAEDDRHTLRQAIAEVLAEIAAAIPAGELAQLPADFTDQLDHYIYGTPKR